MQKFTLDMRSHVYLFIILSLIGGTLGCEPRRTRSGQTDFNDHGQPLKELEAGPPAQPFLVGQRDYTELAPVEPPPIVREREGLKPVETPVQISQRKLNINVDLQEMDFQFVVDSRWGTEKVHLKGNFERNSSKWKTYLYPVDKKVREENRVSATVLCLTANQCDVIVVEIHYYTGEAETKPIQFITGVQGPQFATSGDSDESEHEDETEETTGSQEATPPSSPSKDSSTPPTGKDPAGPPAAPSTTPKPPEAKPPAPSGPPPPRNLEEVPKGELEDQAIQYPRIELESPPESPYRVKGLPPPSKQQAPPAALQAVGFHNAGYLKNGRYLPPQGKGFIRRDALKRQDLSVQNDPGLAWATDRTVEILSSVAETMNAKYPDQPLVIANISHKNGGKVWGVKKNGTKYLAQKSHQTGLDVDLYFYSTNKGQRGSFNGVDGNSPVTQFDMEKNWELFKSLCGAGPADWVMVVFLHNVLKQGLCEYAKKIGEPVNDPNSLAYRTLRCLQPEKFPVAGGKVHYVNSHNDHAHVRLYCPRTEGKTWGCGNTIVSLPAQTGCR